MSTLSQSHKKINVRHQNFKYQFSVQVIERSFMAEAQEKKHRIDTLVVHAGEFRPRFAGAVHTPVFMSTVYEVPVCCFSCIIS